MRINTNTAAMNTYSQLTSANASKSSSLAKLSSGLRINKAGDDAAGLAISEKMKNQISGMTQASRNAQDGISLIQTAEGALSETHSILNRMRDLTVQAANDTNTGDDKKAIQEEIKSLTAEVGRIAKDTKFNTKSLLSGTASVKEDTPTTAAATTSTTNVNAGKIQEALTSADTDLLKAAWEANQGNPHDGVADIKEDISKLTSEEIDSIVSSYNTEATDFNSANEADITAGTTLSKEIIDTAKINEAYSTETPEATPTPTPADNATTFKFQIGANAAENISVKIKDMTAEGLGIDKIDLTSTAATGKTNKDGSEMTIYDEALETLDTAIGNVSSQRADLGAVQNRLDHTVSNLATTKENLSEANSRITDVDMAEEMMSFTKSNILSQASTSMLAQANQMPQSVLSLLQ